MGPLRISLIIVTAISFVLVQVECQGDEAPEDDVGS